MLVPRSCLVRGPAGGWRIHVVRDGRARVQVVRVGLMNDERAEVTSGLREGDLVRVIEDDEVGIQADRGPVVAQDAGAGGVEGADPGVEGAGADQAADPVFHLPGGLVEGVPARLDITFYSNLKARPFAADTWTPPQL